MAAKLALLLAAACLLVLAATVADARPLKREDQLPPSSEGDDGARHAAAGASSR